MKKILKMLFVLFMIMLLTGCAYYKPISIENKGLKNLAAEIRKINSVESCNDPKTGADGCFYFYVIIKDEFSRNDMKEIYSLAKEYIEDNDSLGNDHQLKELFMNPIIIDIRTKENRFVVTYEARYDNSRYYLQNDGFVELLEDTDEPYIRKVTNESILEMIEEIEQMKNILECKSLELYYVNEFYSDEPKYGKILIEFSVNKKFSNNDVRYIFHLLQKYINDETAKELMEELGMSQPPRIYVDVERNKKRWDYYVSPYVSPYAILYIASIYENEDAFDRNETINDNYIWWGEDYINNIESNDEPYTGAYAPYSP